MQMLSSFEDKMKDVPTIDISQYVSARGKSTADAVAVNLQERPAVLSAATGAVPRTEQAEGRTYNVFHFGHSWH